MRVPPKRGNVSDREAGLPVQRDFDLRTLSDGLDPAKLKPSRRNRASITVLTGDGLGRVLRLEEPGILCGSGPDADLLLPDESVSARHARFFLADQQAYVIDLGSSAGTFLRGAKVSGPVRLTHGDHIQLGPNRVLGYSMRDALEEDAAIELYDSAVRDPTSGAFNRRHFDERLELELTHSARSGSPLSLLLLDVDDFKAVNDAHGHVVGDLVLRVVASSISRILRPSDVLFRYGGDEFMVLCRDTTLRNGLILAARISRSVEQLPLTVANNDLRVSVSAGVAVATGGDCVDCSLVVAADRAMFKEKAKRRTGTKC